MPHVHKLIDFTVAAYIVYEGKVLLVDHKKLKTWMPIGGHIELNEDPEQALVREIQEECGLEVDIIGGLQPNVQEKGIKPLLAPLYMDIHDIDEIHRHVALVYFAQAKTSKAVLAAGEHNEIRWFTKAELAAAEFGVRPFIRFYCEQALRVVQG